jgi:predicted nucleic acid-binding protein
MPTASSAFRVVCDASAVVTVLLDSGDDGTWLSRRLTHAELCAPALLPFECANIFRRHQIGGLISADQAAQAHADLLDLPVSLFPYEALAHRVWQLKDNLTSYDASYVALAEALEAPLITLDRRLSTAPGIACAVEVPPVLKK